MFTQDDAAFPEHVTRVDDTSLAMSWHHQIETVPTLMRVAGGVETARIAGWERAEWESFTGVADLGPQLPAWRPGCGSLSVDPDLAPELAVRFGSAVLRARSVELAELAGRADRSAGAAFES